MRKYIDKHGIVVVVDLLYDRPFYYDDDPYLPFMSYRAVFSDGRKPLVASYSDYSYFVRRIKDMLGDDHLRRID